MRIVRCLVASICLLTAPYLGAQTTTSLTGAVTDSSGAAIPNAQVTATNVGTNFARTAQTNTVGEYRIEFLPVGEYTIQFSAGGFKKSLQERRSAAG